MVERRTRAAVRQISPLGQAIRYFREEQSLSQEALAELAGIDKQRISNIERGETRTLHASTLSAIVDGLGITFDDFLVKRLEFDAVPSGSGGVTSVDLELQSGRRISASGRTIRYFREDQRLSQEALAELAGIDKQRISNIERGETRTLHNRTVRAIADGLGLSLAEFRAKEREFAELGGLVALNPRLQSRRERAEQILLARSDDFADLVRLGGFDPANSFRCANLSDVSFAGANLSGFDFTGARLHHCNFEGATIAEARFDQAELHTVFPYIAALHTVFPYIAGRPRTDLRSAKDWFDYVKNWKPPTRHLPDDHLPEWVLFQDAPFAPELFIVGAAEVGPRRLPDPLGAFSHLPVSAEQLQFAQGDVMWKQAPVVRQHVLPPAIGPHQMAYANWLSAKTGRQYWVPPQAEMEALERLKASRHTKNDPTFRVAEIDGQPFWVARDLDLAGRRRP